MFQGIEQLPLGKLLQPKQGSGRIAKLKKRGMPKWPK